MPELNNFKLKGFNWTKVKLDDWNEFQTNYKSAIYILVFFL